MIAIFRNSSVFKDLKRDTGQSSSFVLGLSTNKGGQRYCVSVDVLIFIKSFIFQTTNAFTSSIQCTLANALRFEG